MSFASPAFASTDNVSQGTSADVLKTKQQLNNYIATWYENKVSYRKIGEYSKRLNTKNFDQTTLNDFYNLRYSTTYTGTCSEVATTSLIDYYARYDGINTYTTNEGIFCNTLNFAKGACYYFYRKNGDTVECGTYTKHLPDILNKGMWTYGIDRYTGKQPTGIYDNLKKYVNAGKPVMFNIPNHSMVGSGYVEYTYEYQTKEPFWFGTRIRTYTEVLRFVIVNDGLRDTIPGDEDSQYSYFPANKIGTSSNGFLNVTVSYPRS